VHWKVAEFAILDVSQQIPFTRCECEKIIINNNTQGIHGGRSLDRRIIPAIFRSQRLSGNDRRDHEGSRRIHRWYRVSRATMSSLTTGSEAVELTPFLCKKTV
jgi:hypothetical protein